LAVLKTTGNDLAQQGSQTNLRIKPPCKRRRVVWYTPLMMTATFDTHRFVRRLEAAGLPTPQAESIADAFKEAQGESDLVTRKDLQIELAPIKGDLLLLKWMMGLMTGGVIALILKSFFPAPN